MLNTFSRFSQCQHRGIAKQSCSGQSTSAADRQGSRFLAFYSTSVTVVIRLAPAVYVGQPPSAAVSTSAGESRKWSNGSHPIWEKKEKTNCKRRSACKDG